eukprot:CAMPEP_0119034004 /NCGR_PEP_ID=MMETSP1177-20130426/1064_1 /TAXON_ID=2985 /ORGANISM="Ochromonas sp, Strain CCMP1899" /LENGTH=267 /DNA_ID=CAMNT_0006991173 /DNA_START=610 /DNA_END=1413 /DNA_ORIENTATION=-
MEYLEKNLPSFDKINKASLGFDTVGSVNNDGVARIGTNRSLEMKNKYKWAADVPYEIFLEYVLPYGVVNEGRNNWRLMISEVVISILDDAKELENYILEDIVLYINDNLWKGKFCDDIVFKAGETPMIYDVMSVIAFGYASCTGLSIFLIDALRSVGIPARLVGTSGWNNDPRNGNHNWVEVWVDSISEWQFIQAEPAGGGTFSDPCSQSFCVPKNFNGLGNGKTQVYAARFDQNCSVRFPMAWDTSNTAIPGEDRSLVYEKICSSC